MKRAVVVAVAVIAARILAAQPPEDLTYTRFLVPLYQHVVPGAHASQWDVKTWLFYAGEEPVRIVPAPFCRVPICFFGLTLDPMPIPLPVERGFYNGSAVLFHVDDRYASKMSFTSRVRDLSREEDSAGTQVPVVAEAQIRSEPLQLLDIPVRAGFRNMLRIYALPEVANPEVEVRIYGMPDPQDLANAPRTPLHSQRLHLRTYPLHEHGFRLHPSLIEVPDLQNSPQLAGESAVWVEILPVTEGLRIWAFVSVTNNVTQQVTIIAPGQS